ncbi:MAG: multicopper oxidase [Bryobacterales bacterium]|nr:multicopper oxidase [Bryobacterales bacterium]
MASVQVPRSPLDGRGVPKCVEPVPTFFGQRVTGTNITVSMETHAQQVLPTGFPGPTKVWAYKITDERITRGPLWPAYTIEATRGVPTRVRFVNNLTSDLYKLLTVDQTLHWADPLVQGMSMAPYVGAPVPAVTHLHGGEVPSAFDGYPDAWFTQGSGGQRIVGPGFVSDTYTCPNRQQPATLWFHDHALGLTRLNVYSGLAGFYFLRDPLNEPANLPGGPFDVELMIQDRQFDTTGQLLFPDGFPAGLNGLPPNPGIRPFWKPEFFGDVIVVNGKSWPFLEVQPRRYRFRFLNASNARVYELRIDPGGPPFWQIGTDGGLLDNPVMLTSLVIAPGERADVIIDFSRHAWRTFTLTNSGRAPFPGGAPPDPQTAGQVMQFRVAGGSVADNSYNPATGAPLRSPLVRLASGGALAPGVSPNAIRQLVLVEIEGPGGPIEVLLNNTKWDGALSVNAGGVTELPRVGSTEVWEIVNLTEDAHPIHIHLVQLQLINRQVLHASNYRKVYDAQFPGGNFIPEYGPPLPYGSTPRLGGNPDVGPYLQAAPAPPAANEAGWKDTFIMFPGQVTRVVARWAPQDVPVGGVSAGTNLYSFDPTKGPGYVWHCHILDHEDNEMMRPYLVRK